MWAASSVLPLRRTYSHWRCETYPDVSLEMTSSLTPPSHPTSHLQTHTHIHTLYSYSESIPSCMAVWPVAKSEHIFLLDSLRNYLGSATCAEKVPWQATFFLKQEVDEGNLEAPFDLKYIVLFAPFQIVSKEGTFCCPVSNFTEYTFCYYLLTSYRSYKD